MEEKENGEFIFKSDDPALKHITISIRVGVTSHGSYEATVSDIIDGDTILVSLSPLGTTERVRLLGIDAPEKASDDHAKQQCQYLGVNMDTLHILSKLAAFHLSWLCPVGAKITLKTTDKPRDDYGRILAGLFVGDLSVQLAMVEHGYAIVFQGYSAWESYEDLELQAKQARKGIWGRCEEQYYLASSKSYHRPGCRDARNLTVKVRSMEEAKSSGLGPCSKCSPCYTRTQA